MKKHIIYLFLFLSGIGIAQELNTYTPISPNAASLGKYGAFPVNTNLGTTNISIPLYTIKQGDIEIPISLSYNATSGIRVNEEASWVGLGWTLNAGGAIVRSVKGLPGNGTSLDFGNVQFGPFSSLFVGVTQQRADLNADDFLFNYSGTTGTFTYDHITNKYVFRDYNPISITRGSLENPSINAMMENGTLLKFDAIEEIDRHRNHYIGPGYKKYSTAYYLTKVISANQTDEVTLSYDSHAFDKKSEKTGDQISMALASAVDAPLPSWSPLPPTVSRQNGELEYKSYEKTLKRIDFKMGYVLFDYSLDRLDSQSGKLNHIKVYSTINGSTTLIKKISFKYDYYNRSGGWYDRILQSELGTEAYSKSLKLTGVDVYSNAPTPQQYTFDYNTTALPIRASSGQDFWGYANNNSESYMHKHTTTLYFMGDNLKPFPHITEVGKGDRTANEYKSKAGILTKITYPTGGYTEFEYEANKYTVTVNEPIYRNKNLSFAVDSPDTGCGRSRLSASYTIPRGAIDPVLRYSFRPCLHNQNSRKAFVKVNNDVYQRPFVSWDQEYDNGYSSAAIKQYTNRTYQLELEEFANSIPNYGCAGIVVNVSWKESDGYEAVDKDILVGGLRIKSITSYDGIDTAFTSKKEYTYNKPRVLIPVSDNNYRVLHEIIGEPKLLNIISSHPTYSLNVNGGPSAEYTKVTEYNTDASGIDNGKIVYEYEPTPVYRLMDTGAPGSGSAFTFYKDPRYVHEVCSGGGIFPPFPIDQTHLETIRVYGYGNFMNYKVKSWAGGSLKSQKVYKKSGITYTLLKSIDNAYSTLAESTLPFNHLHSIDPNGMVGPSSTIPGCGGYNHRFIYNKSYISLGKKALTSSKETIYDTNGQNPVVTEKSYRYDHPNHFQTQSGVKNSLGSQLKTKTYYPNQRGQLANLSIDDESAYFKLEQLHRIATPIQTESYMGTTLLSTQRTLFKPGIATNSFFPKSIQTAKGAITTTNPLTDKVQYHKYDSSGNPIEVSRADGRHIMYIWGYQNTYPIAKIENASYIEVSGYIAGLQTKSNADNDRTRGSSGKEGALRDALHAMRVGLPNAMISSYTYDPLIGVTSMTDPKGYTLYYEYDIINRLNYVIDDESKVIEKINYNYQGQQSNALSEVKINLSGTGSIQPKKEVVFTANTIGSSGADLYTWSVDGTQEQCGTTTSFAKTFSSEGSYRVLVVAYNSQAKHSVSKTMNVVVAYPPINVPIVDSDYTHIVKGTNVDFNASNIGGGTGNLRYEWFVNNVKQANTTTTLKYKPGTAGTYNIRFKVIDNNSGKTKISGVKKLYAYNPLNTPRVIASKTHIVRGTTTSFTASNIGGGSGSRRYEWYVNNVKQSVTGVTYSHNFPNTGTYTIKLKVVDLTLQNANSKWSSNTPVLKSYNGMTIKTSQSATSVSGASANVRFSVTNISGGSRSHQITWRVFKSAAPSQTIGSGSSTNFSFSNFATGTHEYSVKATVKDNLTGQKVSRVMIVVASISSGNGGGDCPDCGDQH
ncbi:hypothetical protein [Aquimarina sp. I32.4]|uniref:hypothetical protein n=1 Tax=Aquimarina sp. I32.4 TaxID=2053903 RepID=UPI000CDEC416|nr:hypothetical protein [Aquimarina sp. I32.4]